METLKDSAGKPIALGSTVLYVTNGSVRTGRVTKMTLELDYQNQLMTRLVLNTGWWTRKPSRVCVIPAELAAAVSGL